MVDRVGADDSQDEHDLEALQYRMRTVPQLLHEAADRHELHVVVVYAVLPADVAAAAAELELAD